MSLKNYIIGLSLSSLALAPTAVYATPPIQVESGRFVTVTEEQRRAEEEAKAKVAAEERARAEAEAKRKAEAKGKAKDQDAKPHQPVRPHPRPSRPAHEPRDRSSVQLDLELILAPLRTRVNNLDQDVKKLQGDYQTLKDQLEQYAPPAPAQKEMDAKPKEGYKPQPNNSSSLAQPSREDDQSTQLLRKASKQALDQLAENRQAVDDNCTISYNTALALANEITTTYAPAASLSESATTVDLPASVTLAESVPPTNLPTDPTATAPQGNAPAAKDVESFALYIKQLDADKTVEPYAKATMLTSELLQFAAKLPQAERNRIRAAVVPAYERCANTQSAFAAKENYFAKMLEDNLYETETEKRARIETIIKRMFPELLPKSKWSVSPFLGGQYNTGLHGKVGAEVCYKFDGGIDICVNGAAMLSNPNAETTTSQNQSVAQVGQGYQTTSSFDATTTTNRKSHYSLGPRLGLRLIE